MVYVNKYVLQVHEDSFMNEVLVLERFHVVYR